MDEVTVGIENLVLVCDGAATPDGPALASATEDALRELFEQHGLLPTLTSSGDVAEVIAPDTNGSLSASVEQTGRELARAIYQALGEMR